MPNAREFAFQVQNKSDGAITGHSQSASGQKARLSVGGEGLLGTAIAETIVGTSRQPGESMIRWLQRQNGYAERQTVDEAIATSIQRAGLDASSEKPQRPLLIDLRSVNLTEAQRGYWQVCASVTAKVMDTNQNVIWSAEVDGTSGILRSLDEFSRQPQLYADDFHQAADDAARQLVSGPIRK